MKFASRLFCLFIFGGFNTIAQSNAVDIVKIDSLIRAGYRLHNNNPRLTISGSHETLRLIGDQDLPEKKSEVYKNLGLAYWRLDKYDSSMYYNTLGKNLADSIGDPALSSRLLNNMGLIYRERDQYSLSLKTFLEVLEIQKKYSDSTTLSVILMNVADIYRRMKNYELAKEYIGQAIGIAEKVNAEMTFCWAYVYSIETYYELGSGDEAERFFKLAIPACKAVDNLYHLSVAYVSHSRILNKKKRYNEALGELFKALAIQEAFENPKALASTNIELGKTYLAKNQPKNARKRLLTAYELAWNNNFLEELGEVYYHLAATFRMEGNYQRADQSFSLYHNLKDSLSRVQKGMEIAEITSSYEIQSKEAENTALRRERVLQDEIIEKEKSKNRYFFLVVFTAAILIVSLAVFLISINKKNKRLVRLNDDIVQKSHQLQTTVSQLKNAQDKLVESEKMASLGMLSAGVGHEINNPLNFIRNSIEVMEREVNVSRKDLREFKRYITIINEGVTRISNIVKSLGGFARKSEGPAESCDIHLIIDNCLTILNHKVHGRIKVTKNYHAKLCLVKGNEGKLHQAFLNIISNAEQSILNFGEINITTKVENNRAHISISDTGIGMSEEHLTKIMDPFFTTKSQGQGSGLGLWITYNIIKNHRGAINVESEVNKGTLIKIELPL